MASGVASRIATLERLQEDFRIVRASPAASKCSSIRSGGARSEDYPPSSVSASRLASSRGQAARPPPSHDALSSTSLGISHARLPEGPAPEAEVPGGRAAQGEPERRVQECVLEIDRLRRAVAAVQDSVAESALSQQRDFASRPTTAGILDAVMRELRAELDLRSTQQQAGLAALQAQAEQNRVQLLDARNDLGLLSERLEVLSASTLADCRRDLDALHAGSVQASQASQEQSSRGLAELKRSVHEATAAMEATCGAVRAELRSELERVRAEAQAERLQADEQAAHLSRVEAALKEQGLRLDDVGRRVGEAQQDQLSETTLLRGRLEAAVGDHEQYLSQTESLQRTLAEDRCKQSVQAARVLARLDVLEGDARERAGRGQQPAPEASQQAARLDALERRLQEELPPQARALLQRLEGVPAELAELRAATAELRGRGAAAPPEGGGAPQEALEALRGDVERLGRELAEERRERYKALADVGRFTEDVAKAAAATIGRAEKKFADEFAAGREGLSRSSEAVPVGSDVARLIGEMDAELRVELTSRIKMLIAEVRGEIVSEVAVRTASTDARVSAMEAGWDAQSAHLRERVGKLEAAQAGARVSSLEEELRRLSLLISTLYEDFTKKSLASSTKALLPGSRGALSAGRLDSETATPGTDSSQRAGTQSPGREGSLPKRDPARARPASGQGEGSPKGGPPLPESLKESLQGVVAAVHKTLCHSQPPGAPGAAARQPASEPSPAPRPAARAAPAPEAPERGAPAPARAAEDAAPRLAARPGAAAGSRTVSAALRVPQAVAPGVARAGSQAAGLAGAGSLASSRLAARSSSPGFVPASPQVVTQAQRQSMQRTMLR